VTFDVEFVVLPRLVTYRSAASSIQPSSAGNITSVRVQMVVSLHFRDDINDYEAAKLVVEALPFRSYITWMRGDDQFVLTYHSATFKKPEHVKILRFPDGSYMCEEGRDDTKFRTLQELLQTRAYIDLAHVAARADPPSEPSSTSLRRRGNAGASSDAALGRSELPVWARNPSNNARTQKPAGTASEDYRVAPSCSRRPLQVILASFASVAVLLALAAFVVHRRIEGRQLFFGVFVLIVSAKRNSDFICDSHYLLCMRRRKFANFILQYFRVGQH
jgi:hypothetical protein